MKIVSLKETSKRSSAPPAFLDPRAESEFDIILCLESLPAGFAFGGARFGMWSLEYSDSIVIRAQPPCFWEVYLRHGTTGATLLTRASEDEPPRVLATAAFPT